MPSLSVFLLTKQEMVWYVAEFIPIPCPFLPYYVARVEGYANRPWPVRGPAGESAAL